MKEEDPDTLENVHPPLKIRSSRIPFLPPLPPQAR